MHALCDCTLCFLHFYLQKLQASKETHKIIFSKKECTRKKEKKNTNTKQKQTKTNRNKLKQTETNTTPTPERKSTLLQKAF